MINKKAVKKFILEKIKEKRPFLGVNRVSASAYIHFEAILRARILEEIMKYPSKGKTFKP